LLQMDPIFWMVVCGFLSLQASSNHSAGDTLDVMEINQSLGMLLLPVALGLPAAIAREVFLHKNFKSFYRDSGKLYRPRHYQVFPSLSLKGYAGLLSYWPP